MNVAPRIPAREVDPQRLAQALHGLQPQFDSPRLKPVEPVERFAINHYSLRERPLRATPPPAPGSRADPPESPSSSCDERSCPPGRVPCKIRPSGTRAATPGASSRESPAV